jgi:hypothetical protein
LGQNPLKIHPKFHLSLTSNPLFLPSRPGGPAFRHSPPPFPLQAATHHRPTPRGHLPHQPSPPRSTHVLTKKRALQVKVLSAEVATTSSLAQPFPAVQHNSWPTLAHRKQLRPPLTAIDSHRRWPHAATPEPTWPPGAAGARPPRPLFLGHYPPSSHALNCHVKDPILLSH